MSEWGVWRTGVRATDEPGGGWAFMGTRPVIMLDEPTARRLAEDWNAGVEPAPYEAREHAAVVPLDKDPSWREKKLAERCQDKRLVFWIRPTAAGGPWLLLTDVADILDHVVLEGEPNDEWEMKWSLMTEAEIEALPEHDGW